MPNETTKAKRGLQIVAVVGTGCEAAAGTESV